MTREQVERYIDRELAALEQAIGPLPRPSLDEGIRETMARFRAAG
jgi:hypothetical protein